MFTTLLQNPASKDLNNFFKITLTKLCLCVLLCTPNEPRTPAGSPSLCCLLIGHMEQPADFQHSSPTANREQRCLVGQRQTERERKTWRRKRFKEYLPAWFDLYTISGRSGALLVKGAEHNRRLMAGGQMRHICPLTPMRLGVCSSHIILRAEAHSMLQSSPPLPEDRINEWLSYIPMSSAIL